MGRNYRDNGPTSHTTIIRPPTKWKGPKHVRTNQHEYDEWVEQLRTGKPPATPQPGKTAETVQDMRLPQRYLKSRTNISRRPR